MKLIVAALLAMIVTSGAFAGLDIPFPGTSDRIAVPQHSPVHYSGFHSSEGIVSFRGKFLLTGTYYFGDNDFNDSGDENPSKYAFDPQAYIIPDKNVTAELPHFVIRNGQQLIHLKNPNTFATAVLSKQAIRRVQCRQCGSATGHIAVWVDQFTAGIDCDSPVYEVRFLSVDRLLKTEIVPRPDRAC